MVKKKSGWQAGMLVYMRNLYGTDAGRINEENLYRIRQIGTKQATIDRIDKITLEKRWHRGQNIYLLSREEAEQRNRAQEERNNAWRSLSPWDWSQVFVLQGEAGWDPDQNF